MRHYSVAARAFLSLGIVTVLALVFVLPSQLQSVTEARPLLQATTPSPTINPNQPVDLRVDDNTKSGDPGTFVTYNFSVTNRATGGCPAPNNFVIAVTGSQFSPTFPTQITAGPGETAQFSVQFFIPTNAQRGATDAPTVSASCQGNNQFADREQVITTVTGPTPTFTITPTRTVTPTATVGPSPTTGPICLDGAEPDNNPANAREIRPDITLARVMCPTGDQDWFYFGAISGKVYTIDVPVMADGLDLTISLFDSVNNLVAFNDDFPRNNDATDIRPRVQSWRAPADGTYFIRVRDNAGRGGTNLSYNIILISESYGPTPTLIPELCTDLYEPDGVPELATLIGIRETQPNHRLCPAGDADWIRFFAKVGARYALRTNSNARPGTDTVMVLTDRDGITILDVNDDFGDTLDSRIEFSPSVDGFYFVQVKNVGDLGNQFIAYDFFFEPLGVAQPTPGVRTPTPPVPIGTPGVGTPTPTVTTAGATPGTATPTPTGTRVTPTRTPTPVATPCPPDVDPIEYPECDLDLLRNMIDGPKGQPPFVNGPARDFIDPAFGTVWSHTDQPVASGAAERTWMWGPTGLVGRAEVYQQANGGARQVQYFDKARMEITDWNRDRSNQWFVTNGLLVRELIEGKMQIGDNEFMARTPADIGIAGDAGDPAAPTYRSLSGLLGRVPDRTGETGTSLLRRDGSVATVAARPEARLATYVPETGHHVAQVFWDFLQSRGKVGDGSREDTLVDWVFAMGYPISEPYWTRVKVDGVERAVLVQAFQRRVLTYTPSNPAGWQVEMGNVGRHYYWWRYGRQP